MSDDLFVRLPVVVPRPFMYELRKKYWEDPGESRLTHISLGDEDLAYFRSREDKYEIAREIADEIEDEHYAEMWLSW